jgi:hydroxyquinol 1,2-dioxygenase
MKGGDVTAMDALTEEVLARLSTCADPRLREVMASLVRHLHAFAREVRLTEAEWLAGVEFLTAIGQTCTSTRQETILLSDTLGLSMLVDALNHDRDGATPGTVFGPFYRAGSPALAMGSDLMPGAPGEPAFVCGRVLDLAGAPIGGALLDIWQVDGEGLYDVQRDGDARYGRGQFTTDADGRFWLRTVRPVSYRIPSDGPVGRMLAATGRHPWRPAHVHALVSAPGYEAVATHIFVAKDPYLGSDAVFGVKDGLIVDFVAQAPGMAPDGVSMDRPWCLARFDFRLAPAGTIAASDARRLFALES